MLQPKRTKYRRPQKGRCKGNAQRGNQLAFGSFGIKSLDTHWLTGRQIEAARIAMTRYMQREGQSWIRIFPDKPITKKPADVRMGKGKGDPVGYVFPITPGRIIFEIEGVPFEVAKEALRLAEAAPEVGNALPLQNIPVGTVIHNIELRPGQGALLVRSAGNFAQLTSREGKYCVIKLPSGETRQILSACKATIGSVGNSDHALESSGKAGRSRWMGRRPHNRGVVMNPVDHPMGGGEGRQSGGHPRSRTGLYAKGLKTRAPKKQSNKYIIERRKK